MISIIIPVLNEATQLQSVLRHTFKIKGDFEIICVDGGSTDRSIQILQSFPKVRFYQSRKGRSYQMNKGAKAAAGDILLFLHADTLLPKNALSEIELVMETASNVGGSFYLKFDKKHWILSFYSRLSQINSSLFTYGDHGIFIRKFCFQQIKGYKPISFMEDIEIQLRLRKIGNFVKLPFAITTSARRFTSAGPIKQFFTDVLLVAFYRIGIPPRWIKQFYPD